eukprot:1697988-Alexandrium_andersonii.AAC.1
MDRCHPNCRLVALMVHELLHSPVDFAILECTQRLPAEVLENGPLKELYYVSTQLLCPSDFGHPC